MRYEDMGRNSIRYLIVAVISLFLGLLVACQPTPDPVAAPPAQATDPRILSGRADFPPRQAPWQLLQIPNEMIQKATISLIDATTNVTLATGMTDMAGGFTFAPGSQLALTNGQVFFLEAVRGFSGLDANALPVDNAVGVSAARMRTFLQWTPQGWVSLTGKALAINPATTALGIIHGIKLLSYDNFFNALSPVIDPLTSNFNSGNTGVDPNFVLQYGKVKQFVTEILAAESDPIAHVKFDTDGLYYYKTVTSLPQIAGKVTTLIGGSTARDGIGPDATFLYPRSLAVGPGGMLFVAEYYNNKIRVLDPASRQVTTLTGSGQYGFQDGPPGNLPTSARFYDIPDICFDATRNRIYVTDFHNQRIRQVDASTGVVSTLIGNGGGYLDGPTAVARVYYPMGCGYDGSKYLYIGDSYNHLIRRVDLDTLTVTTVAGSNPGLADGIGAAAKMYYPGNIVVDSPNKVLYFSDRANHSIRKINLDAASPQFHEVTTVANGQINGSGYGTAGYANGIGIAARFNDPYGLALDAATQTLYVADHSNGYIRQINLATQAVTSLTNYIGTGIKDGPQGTATSYHPIGLALIGSTLYFTDWSNHLVRKIDMTSPTKDVTTIAGSLHRDGIGTDTRLYNVNGMTGPVKDGDKHLFLAETYTHIISRYDLETGQLQTIAGKMGDPGFADGIGTAAKFNNPYRMVYDGTQFLYVADRDNRSIRKIDVFTFQVTTLNGGPGAGSYNDGPLAAMMFDSPSGIAYDKLAQKLYVMESTRLREVDIFNGTATTVAGNAAGGLVDGTLTAGRFSGATGLVFLGKGRFFTLQGNQLREIDIPKNKVATVAGTTGGGYADGAGNIAAFSGPYDLVSDGVGNIFISDYNNQRIRKYEIGTGQVSSVIGGGSGVPKLDGRGASAMLLYPYAMYYDRFTSKLYMGEYRNDAYRANGFTYGGNTIKVIE